MSDSRFALQNNCGCCEGVGTRAPVVIHNRSGLSAINYRIGKHGEMLASMVARLSSKDYPKLANLTTRDSDDFSIALLDGYSCVGDVLSFYQERIANESYLRTAGERFSLQEMARLVGYRLNPGVAAETYLAFNMEDSVGAPERVTLETGIKVQSVPGQDEKPQTFETVEKIEAHKDWNAIPCQTSVRWVPAMGDKSLYLDGTGHQLQPGDVILIVGNLRRTKPESERWDARMVERVEVDNDNDRTRLSWKRGLGHTSPYSVPATAEVDVYVFREQASLFGHNAVDPHMLHIAGTGLEALITDYIWDNFVISEKEIDLAGPYKKIVPQSWLLLVSNKVSKSNDAIPGYVELYRADAVTIRSRSDFGFSTKITRIKPDTNENISSTRYTLRDTLVYAQSELLPTIDRPLNYPLYGDSIALDGKIEGFSAKKVLGLSGKRSRIGIEDDDLDLILSDGTDRSLNRGDSLQLSAIPSKLTGSTSLLLSPEEFGKSLNNESGDELRLTLVDRDDTQGTLVVKSNQIKLLPAEEADSLVTEIVFIADLPSPISPTRDTTLVELSSELTHIYDRSSVRINGNVAKATHGETVSQILGSGQAHKSHQRFSLKHAPLTFVSADNETGAVSALEVRVNDIAWHEQNSLYTAVTSDRAFMTRIGEDGEAHIQFGDGHKGTRLPTGQENIHATYRKGIGSVGNLKSNQLSQLLTRPLGLKSVTNLQPSSGGVDAEKEEDARRNIPLGVRTLGRAVSLQDYEDYARAYTGIAKAKAQVLPIRGIRTILITVAGKDGLQLQAGGPTLTNLLSSLRKNSDPFVACDVASYMPTYFKLGLRVKHHPDHDNAKVLNDVEKILRKSFSFTDSNFGQLIARSQVILVAQQVKGVVGVDVDHFYRGDNKDLKDRLFPNSAFEDANGVTVGAELLFLDPGPLDNLEVMV